jgi:hypothetical protein
MTLLASLKDYETPSILIYQGARIALATSRYGVERYSPGAQLRNGPNTPLLRCSKLSTMEYQRGALPASTSSSYSTS